MADNYDQSTVEPAFPIQAVSEFEKVLMKEYGYTNEIWDKPEGDTVYFYAPEGITSDIEHLDIGIVSRHASEGDPIALDLIRCVTEEGEDKLDSYIMAHYSFESIIQGILKKPGCSYIGEVCVMGANTCSKMRPGEFGGWVMRITRETVKYDDTYTAYRRMQAEEEFLSALDLVYQLADSNCLDQENEPDPDDPDEDLDDPIFIECRRQRDALNAVHDYLTNHGCIR